jgi:hypothetical protein
MYAYSMRLCSNNSTVTDQKRRGLQPLHLALSLTMLFAAPALSSILQFCPCISEIQQVECRDWCMQLPKQKCNNWVTRGDVLQYLAHNLFYKHRTENKRISTLNVKCQICFSLVLREQVHTARCMHRL